MNPGRRSALADPKDHEKKSKKENRHIQKGEAGIAEKPVKKIKDHLVKPVGIEVLVPGYGVSVGIHGWHPMVLDDPFPSLQVKANVGDIDLAGREGQEKHETSG